MNQIEIDARDRHGDLLYRLTREARTTNKKLLWFVVYACALARLIVGPLGISLFVFLQFQFVGASVALASTISVAMFVVTLTLLSGKDTLLGAASSFYSIAADVKRAQLGGLFKLLYLAAGATSVILAMVVYMLHLKKTQHLPVTDLDVLGSIFSKAGAWAFAHRCYDIISMKYAERDLHFLTLKDRRMQISVSFALACKWIMMSPSKGDQKNVLLAMIRSVMDEYPDLPPEVTIRLEEAFTM